MPCGPNETSKALWFMYSIGMILSMVSGPNLSCGSHDPQGSSKIKSSTPTGFKYQHGTDIDSKVRIWKRSTEGTIQVHGPLVTEVCCGSLQAAIQAPLREVNDFQKKIFRRKAKRTWAPNVETPWFNVCPLCSNASNTQGPWT